MRDIDSSCSTPINHPTLFRWPMGIKVVQPWAASPASLLNVSMLSLRTLALFSTSTNSSCANFKTCTHVFLDDLLYFSCTILLTFLDTMIHSYCGKRRLQTVFGIGKD